MTSLDGDALVVAALRVVPLVPNDLARQLGVERATLDLWCDAPRAMPWPVRIALGMLLEQLGRNGEECQIGAALQAATTESYRAAFLATLKDCPLGELHARVNAFYADPIRNHPNEPLLSLETLAAASGMSTEQVLAALSLGVAFTRDDGAQ